MNTRHLLIGLLASLFFISTSRAAEGSFKDWRNAMKAAEQARYQRDFEKMRQILEGSAVNAQKQGALSSAENSFWLAFAYQRLNLPDRALETFNSELERIGPNPTAKKLQILRGLLLTYRGLLYFNLSEYDKAMDSAETGKATLEEVAGKFHPELYEAHMIIGRIHAMRKNYAEAEKSMRSAFKLAQSKPTAVQTEWSGYEQQTVMYVGDAAPHRVVLAATDLGAVLRMQSKFEEAEDVLKTGVKSARAAYPKDSVMQLLPLRGLAEVQLKQGNRKEFLKSTDQIYELTSKLQGLEPVALDPMWLKLAVDLDDRNATEAEATLRKVEKISLAQNFDYADFAPNAMAVAVKDGAVDWVRVETLQQALSRIAERYTSTDTTKAGLIYVAMANFAVENNKPELAEGLYDRTLKSQQSAKDKALLIGVLGKLAEMKIAAGKKADALPLYHQVSAAMHEKYGNDMRVAAAIDKEASLMKELGQEDAAKQLQQQAMEVRKKSLGR